MAFVAETSGRCNGPAAQPGPCFDDDFDRDPVNVRLVSGVGLGALCVYVRGAGVAKSYGVPGLCELFEVFGTSGVVLEVCLCDVLSLAPCRFLAQARMQPAPTLKGPRQQYML